MVMEQNPEKRSAPYVYFFDSLGKSTTKSTIIRDVIHATGIYDKAHIIDLSPSEAVQTDSYTCGTWLTEMAQYIVNTRNRKKFNEPSWPEGHMLTANPKTIEQKHIQTVQLFQQKPYLLKSSEKSSNGPMVSQLKVKIKSQPRQESLEKAMSHDEDESARDSFRQGF